MESRTFKRLILGVIAKILATSTRFSAIALLAGIRQYKDEVQS